MESSGESSTLSLPVEPAAVIARSSLLSSAALLLALAVWLLVRRLAGVFTPLAPGVYLLSGLLLMAATSGWRQIWLHAYWPSLWTRRAVALGTSVLLATVVAVMSLPGTEAWALIVLWSLVVAHEAGWWWRLAGARGLSRPLAPQPAAFTVDELLGESLPPPEADVSQRVMRYVDLGQDMIVADFRCRFQGGERVQALHAVFCPPFAGLPEIATEHLQGPSVSLRIVQAQSYGARLEVRRLGGGDQPADILVRMVARAPAAE
jgi:hypothetical protein